jgi:hypothetical protein
MDVLPRTMTHRCFLGGTSRQRALYALKALKAWQRETGTLSEACWILVSHQSQVDAWRALHHDVFPQDLSFQGLKIKTWYQWSQHWLNQAFALAPYVVKHLHATMGIPSTAPSTTDWHQSRDAWQVVNLTELRVMFDAFRSLQHHAHGYIASPEEDAEWEALVPGLLEAFVSIRHVEAWYEYCRLSTWKHPTLQLEQLFEWCVLRLLSQGCLPASWMLRAVEGLFTYFREKDPDALRYFSQQVGLCLVDHANVLSEETLDWMQSLDAEGTTFWVLGDDFSFNTTLEALPLSDPTDETRFQALTRPPFWDLLTHRLRAPLRLIYLPDEMPDEISEEIIPPTTGASGLKSYFKALWDSSASSVESFSVEAFNVFKVEAHDETAPHLTILKTVLSLMKASPSSTPWMLVLPTRREKRVWQAHLTGLLAGVTDTSREDQSWQEASRFLKLCAQYPNISITPETVFYTPQQGWQLSPYLWMKSPELAEAWQARLQGLWEILSIDALNRTVPAFTPDEFLSFIAQAQAMFSTLLGRVPTKGTTPLTEALKQWQILWEKGGVESSIWSKRWGHLQKTEAQLNALWKNDALPFPAKAWVHWMQERLAYFQAGSEKAAFDHQTSAPFFKCYTLDEVPPPHLEHVLVLGLFPTVSRLSGLDTHLDTLKTASGSSPQASLLLSRLQDSQEALTYLETLVHRLAGAPHVTLLLSEDERSRYSEAQVSLYHYFIHPLLQSYSVEASASPFKKETAPEEGEAFSSEDLPPPLFKDLATAIQDAQQNQPSDIERYASYGQFNATSLSPTDVDSYLKCPRKMYYSRFKFSLPFKDTAVKGVLFHKIMELFHQAVNRGTLPFSAEALRDWVTLCLRNDPPLEAPPPEALLTHSAFQFYAQAPVVRRQRWVTHLLNAVNSLEEEGFFNKIPTQVDAEYRLNGAFLPELSGFNWRISIDAIYHDAAGSRRLVDYKTSKRAFSQREETRQDKVNTVIDALPLKPPTVSGYDPKVTEDRYWQLPLYLLLYEAHTQSSVAEAGLQMLRSPQENSTGSVWVPFDVPRFHQEQKEWLNAFQDKVLQPLWHDKLFKANPHPAYCDFCDYALFCDATVLEENNDA